MVARHLVAFARDQRGATAIEYGLIVSLIFLAVVGSYGMIAGNFSNMMDKVSEAIGTAIGGS